MQFEFAVKPNRAITSLSLPQPHDGHHRWPERATQSSRTWQLGNHESSGYALMMSGTAASGLHADSWHYFVRGNGGRKMPTLEIRARATTLVFRIWLGKRRAWNSHFRHHLRRTDCRSQSFASAQRCVTKAHFPSLPQNSTLLAARRHASELVSGVVRLNS